jgi:hypothetical protein
MTANRLGELSYEAAVRALDVQERGVEQLRARTGVLLAASSLTASFLGAQAIQHANGLDPLGALALISLAGSIAASIYVLLPKSGLSSASTRSGFTRRCFRSPKMRRRFTAA